METPVEAKKEETKPDDMPSVNHWFVLHDAKAKNTVDRGDALYFAYICSVATLYIMLALFLYVRVFKAKKEKSWKQPIEPSGTYSSWHLS